jgi:hypothetical protein
MRGFVRNKQMQKQIPFGNDKQKGGSRFPAGTTNKKAEADSLRGRQTIRRKQIPCGDDKTIRRKQIPFGNDKQKCRSRFPDKNDKQKG